MSFVKINKARVATKQNIIDIAIQEYGSIEGLFKVIDENPNWALTIQNAVLTDFISELIKADNRTEQEIENVKKFFLEDHIVVNEDMETYAPPMPPPLGAYSSGYSLGYS